MKIREAFYSEEFKREVQDFKKELADIELDSMEMGHITGGDPCGALCQHTCSWYCAAGCELECNNNCVGSCSDIFARPCYLCSLVRAIIPD